MGCKECGSDRSMRSEVFKGNKFLDHAVVKQFTPPLLRTMTQCENPLYFGSRTYVIFTFESIKLLLLCFVLLCQA